MIILRKIQIMHLTKTVITFCLFIFSLSSISQTPQQDTTINGNVFEKVESEADFPGGIPEWRKYLEKKLSAFSPAENGAPVGKYNVIARFVVSKDGSISDIQAETKFGYGMEQEVVKIISQSGKWTPAIQNGRPVNAYRRQPVTFMVESNDYAIITDEPYVLYAGVDNIVTVKAGNLKPDNTELSVQGGTATATADGKFIIRVKKPGRTIIEISNIKKNKSIGSVSFEVKTK